MPKFYAEYCQHPGTGLWIRKNARVYPFLSDPVFTTPLDTVFPGVPGSPSLNSGRCIGTVIMLNPGNPPPGNPPAGWALVAGYYPANPTSTRMVVWDVISEAIILRLKGKSPDFDPLDYVSILNLFYVCAPKSGKVISKNKSLPNNPAWRNYVEVVDLSSRFVWLAWGRIGTKGPGAARATSLINPALDAVVIWLPHHCRMNGWPGGASGYPGHPGVQANNQNGMRNYLPAEISGLL